jgi:hypothetical protein
MGIHHYNCEFCERIFPDVDDHTRCDYCDAVWCDDCKHSVERFIYDGKQRCDFCWHGAPTPVPQDKLLDFALQRLDTTRDALEKFECVRCPTDCASDKCALVGENHYPDDPPSDHPEDCDDDLDNYRGYCCAAQGKPLHARCDACQRWFNHQSATALLGLRSKRRTVFTELPRDVLRCALIVPHVLPAKHERPREEKPQNQTKRRKKSEGRK